MWPLIWAKAEACGRFAGRRAAPGGGRWARGSEGWGHAGPGSSTTSIRAERPGGLPWPKPGNIPQGLSDSLGWRHRRRRRLRTGAHVQRTGAAAFLRSGGDIFGFAGPDPRAPRGVERSVDQGSIEDDSRFVSGAPFDRMRMWGGHNRATRWPLLSRRVANRSAFMAYPHALFNTLKKLVAAPVSTVRPPPWTSPQGRRAVFA